MLDELNHNPTSETVGPVMISTDVDAGTRDNESNDTCETLHSSPRVNGVTKRTGSLGFRKGMVIASLNVNSLPLHKDELSAFINDKGIHILALNETKLDKKTPKQLMNIKSYKIELEDRNRHGGGVAIYIRESINHSRRDDIPSNDLELVCIEIKPVKASPFIVLAWYRPPSDPVATFEKLEQVLQFFERENKEIILLGDTNCDLLAVEKEVSLNVEHNDTKRIEELYQLYGLTQLISEPTRETCRTSTLIDHIAVSAASNIVESGVLKVSLSDHYMIFCVRKYRGALKGQHKKVTTRQMKDFDQNSFLSDISSVDWDSILDCSKDINTAVENWSNVLSMIIEKHAPMRHRRVSEKYCPWITTQLKA